jgi:hypothetical protein
MSLPEAVVSTNEFWENCPFVPYYLDPDDTDKWPDPWELITENYYCDLAKCLGIVYTLHLTTHGSNLNAEIRAYKDTKTNYMYHIAYFCHGKYVLNLIESEVVNKEHINQNLQLKRCYTADDLKLEQY